MGVLGHGWDSWHHPWSAAGHEFKGYELENNIKKVMKTEKKRNISAKPLVDVSTRNKLALLATISPDIIRLDTKKQQRKGR